MLRLKCRIDTTNAGIESKFRNYYFNALFIKIIQYIFDNKRTIALAKVFNSTLLMLGRVAILG